MAVSAEPNSFLHHLMVAGCRATEQGFCERSSPEYLFRADGGPPRLSRWVWRPPRKVFVWRANGEAMAKGTAVRWGPRDAGHWSPNQYNDISLPPNRNAHRLR